MNKNLVKMEVYPQVYHGDNYSEIFLVDDETVLPIFVSYTQADSIINGLEGRRFHRPFTHDLFIEVINLLGASIKKVIIDDLVNGVFLAKLYIECVRNGKSEEIVVDARPSDCIALAVREGCDIFVDKKVLEEAGRSRKEMGMED